MEFWDVYDENRRPTGKTVRRDIDPLGRGEYHLVVHACVFSSAGKLLIQRRSPLCKKHPNLWDVTAGGSALAGETGGQAAARELWEEVGIRLTFSRPAFTVYHKNAIEDVFAAHADPDLSALSLEDKVSEVRWADEEDVLALLRAGQFVIRYEGYIRLLFEKKEA